MADADLLALLATEIERYLPAFVEDASLDPPAPAPLGALAADAPAHDPATAAHLARRALHSLKGSAAVAGERPLSEALARLERRLVAGDADALPDARALLARTLEAVRAGREPPVALWPQPPDDLQPLAAGALGIKQELYSNEMRERVARIDAALADETDERAAANSVMRDVHAMKGAALAVGDELTAWFCHGLEERLQASARGHVRARDGLEEVTRFRGVLAELGAHPESALLSLRMLVRGLRRASRPGDEPLPLPPRREELRRREPERERELDAPPASRLAVAMGDDAARDAAPPSQALAGAWVRVESQSLERLSAQVRSISAARADVGGRVPALQRLALEARAVRSELAVALRLIGPPKPWGAPAAAISRLEHAAQGLAALAQEVDAQAAALRQAAERLRDDGAAARESLAAMRTATAARLFDRVVAAASAQARREGREVRFRVTGAETPLDRRLADALFDPLLQLAHNSVAHGIEAAAERAMRGKQRVGVVGLHAERRGGALRVRVDDDGAGVDVADVRARAMAAGLLSMQVARAADDDTLLGLLFLPGLSTRDSVDVLAGRGVGLDLVLESVRRLGGNVRLASRPGAGVVVTVDVPLERAELWVLWVRAGGRRYALRIDDVVEVRRAPQTSAPTQSLAALLAPKPASPPPSSHRPEGRASRPPPSMRASRPPPPPSARDSSPPSVREPREPEALFAVLLRTSATAPPALWLTVDAVEEREEVEVRPAPRAVAAAGPYLGVVVQGEALALCLDATAIMRAVNGL